MSFVGKISGQIRKMSTGGYPSLPKVLEVLRTFAPETLAEPWDNVGLLVEPATPKPVSGVLLTNDLTEEVLQEAVKLRADLVISYHPPLFEPLKRITQASWKERIVATCLERGIAVYSPHTAWDSVRGGVNDCLGKFLSEKYDKGEPIVPNKDRPDCGAGRIYQSLEDGGMSVSEIIAKLKLHISTPDQKIPVALVHPLTHKVKSVALCAGSGWSVLKGQKAELFITGEMSHHSILDANHSGSSVLLTNHSNSERMFLPTAKAYLESHLEGVSVNISSVDRDPLSLDTI
ncbi:NIF3-like protein 1 [Phlebotomus papatasi]|uniref:NIF3-like protein 1 n=1 Tax=Phlebotomus papatasi TaxID=29031 RepID=UPI002483486E|nr:NIF3-like protein 1 [Phlebotomus papatasi]